MSTVVTPESQRTDVWAWNRSSLEFDRLSAVRCAPDTWEIVDVPKSGSAVFDPGDLVACELSDGELLVRSRVWSGRLL